MRRRASLRASAWVALALLAAIGSDLIVERWCHEPPGQLGAAPALQDAGQERDADPCATVCVPDCFCCARSTLAAPLLMPPGVRFVDVVESPSAPGRRSGVLPLPDPPPLARA